MWKIYYDDKKTFTDKDGNPEEAPCRGVLVITQSCERVGRAVTHSRDYYIYSKRLGGWEGVDTFGLFDYLSHPGFKIVKFGRTVTNEEWNEVLLRAVDDPELPKKSGWLPRERRMVK